MQLNFVLGTAAELIKVYPLISLALASRLPVRVIATGQSRENFLMQYRDLHLPEETLRFLMKNSGDLKKASSALSWFLRAMTTSKKHFRSLTLSGRRSFILVHGDTLSTLVGANLARQSKLSLVHIEAGLRSRRLLNPFPEEITRRVVSRLADYHMAPDAHAVQNLKTARVKGEIFSTEGNTLADAVEMIASSSDEKTDIPFGLVNVHRFENLNSDERWSIIRDTVLRAAEKRKMIFVAHPQTLQKLETDKKTRADFLAGGVEIRERMPFSEFIGLLKDSEFLISDGGSNQEECSYLGKPCLLLRLETERQEGLGTCCVLSKFDPSVIDTFLSDVSKYEHPPQTKSSSPSRRILAKLEANV